jgi:hypothetical protein
MPDAVGRMPDTGCQMPAASVGPGCDAAQPGRAGLRPGRGSLRWGETPSSPTPSRSAAGWAAPAQRRPAQSEVGSEE